MTVVQPEGYLALPETSQGPGVLVLHAWWGLHHCFQDLCNQLAREGFVAFAPDLYHGQLATTIVDAERLRNTLKEESAQADIHTAIEYLQSLEAVTSTTLGVVGFSLGAYFALGVSRERPKDVRAVVLFYGTRSGDYTSAQAAYLGHFAEADEWESSSDVKRLEQQLRAAHRPVTFYTYAGTGHWFFEKDRADAIIRKRPRRRGNEPWPSCAQHLRHRWTRSAPRSNNAITGRILHTW